MRHAYCQLETEKPSPFLLLFFQGFWHSGLVVSVNCDCFLWNYHIFTECYVIRYDKAIQTYKRLKRTLFIQPAFSRFFLNKQRSFEPFMCLYVHHSSGFSKCSHLCRREDVGFKESEEECLTEKGREFQFTGPMYWKALSPGSSCPSWEHEKSEYPKLSEDSKKSRAEATRRGMKELYQRQYGSRW